MRTQFGISILILLFPCLAFAQLWTKWDESGADRRAVDTRQIIPDKYDTYQLDFEGLVSILPQYEDLSGKEVRTKVTLQFPVAGGKMTTFECHPYAIMMEGLASRYPDIRAYRGHSEDGAALYFTTTPAGFRAAIRKGGKTWYIDPYSPADTRHYILYDISDYRPDREVTFSCGAHTLEDNYIREKKEEWLDLSLSEGTRRNSGGTVTGPAKELYRYRLAMAATGEYTSRVGGTKAAAMAAIVNIVNRVNSIYEIDNAITFQLVDNNDNLIYLNGTTDPYTNGSPGTMIDENQSNVTSVIGVSNFDIGHVLGTSTSVNGLARLFGACSNSWKAMGVSSHEIVSGDPFVVSVVCHEMGHQFGAYHTMYHCHNVTPFNAVEPGSGSTIMSYAGICSPASRNTQEEADPYFHTNSLSQIESFTRFDVGGSCAEKIDIGNTEPVVSLDHNSFYNIPIRTPFKLSGVAHDAEDENLTYCWEQIDAGPYDPDNEPQLGAPQEDAALFRSYPPSESPTRYFPSLDYLTINDFNIFEILPTYQRNLTFALMVRDNHPGGGAYGRANMSLTANASAGPFRVLSPINDTTVRAGSGLKVVWDVSDTDMSPVNCQAVNILLSTDAGMTYPTTLLYGTANDGTETVIVPNSITSEARIMVEAADNVFFDISGENFSIAPAINPAYYVNFENQAICVCLPDVIEIEIPTNSMAGYSEPIDFSYVDPGIPGADIQFQSDQVVAGNPGTLVLDMNNVTVEGDFVLEFRAESTNGVTFVREIEIATVSNDFSSFTLDSPENGATGISTSPIFQWTRIDDADNYTFELATSPSFSEEDIVAREFNLLTGAHTLASSLDPSQVYYWRVIAQNECGSHPAPVFAFQTETVVCNIYESEGPAQSFPANEAVTINSQIEITDDLSVDDINLRRVRGSHNDFADLSMTLTAPDNSSVLLIDQRCSDPAAFDFGFNDESSFLISACDFSNAKLLQPENPLSGLDGINTNGLWTLTIQDHEESSGGIFFSWSIEMCATLNPSNPYLVRNDTLKVKPSKGRNLTDLFLFADDDDNGPAEIIFTLVSVPANGQLLFIGVPLEPGDTFTQNDILDESIVYKHDGGPATDDSFRFTLSDPDGGFFGTPRFSIRMDTSVDVTSVRNELTEREIRVYPNPARNVFHIELLETSGTIGNILMFDSRGRLCIQRAVPSVSSTTIDAGGLMPGMYILHIITDRGVAIRKLLIQRGR